MEQIGPNIPSINVGPTRKKTDIQYHPSYRGSWEGQVDSLIYHIQRVVACEPPVDQCSICCVEYTDISFIWWFLQRWIGGLILIKRYHDCIHACRDRLDISSRGSQTNGWWVGLSSWVALNLKVKWVGSFIQWIHLDRLVASGSMWISSQYWRLDFSLHVRIKQIPFTKPKSFRFQPWFKV